MSHTFTIIEGECDLEDDPLKDELDFSKLKVDVERTEKYRALARACLIRLAPDTAGEVEQKAA